MKNNFQNIGPGLKGSAPLYRRQIRFKSVRDLFIGFT